VTELEATNAIYSTLIAGWETPPLGLHARDATNYPAVADDPLYVPLALKNETFAPDQLGHLGAYARVTIIWSTAEQTTQGDVGVREYEPSGFIFVDFFVDPNAGTATLSGTATLASLSDDVRTILRGKRLGDTELCTYEGESRNGPDAPDWATQSVVFRFSFEQTG
jgi:hypothetical protein